MASTTQPIEEMNDMPKQWTSVPRGRFCACQGVASRPRRDRPCQHFNNSLTDLDLTSNALTAWGVAEVAAALPNTFTLYRLRPASPQPASQPRPSLCNDAPCRRQHPATHSGLPRHTMPKHL